MDNDKVRAIPFEILSGGRNAKNSDPPPPPHIFLGPPPMDLMDLD